MHLYAYTFPHRPLDLDLSKLKASEDDDDLNHPKAFMEPSTIAKEPLSVALRQRLSCVVVANLSEEPDNFDYLVDSGVIPELLVNKKERKRRWGRGRG